MKKLFLVLIASVTLITGANAASKKPNIVLIMTDDQDDNGSISTMPTVTALAQQGVRFINSYASQPLCAPSRSSFLSGQYPHNHGILGNVHAYGAFQPREDRTIGPWLQSAGYQTAYIGKIINGYGEDSPPHALPGWNEFDGWIPNDHNKYYEFSMYENGHMVQYGPNDYSTDIFKTKAVNFIKRQHNSSPFFLLLTPNAPHRPHIPAARHVGMFSSLPFERSPAYDENDVSDKPPYIQEMPLIDAAGDLANEVEFRQKRECLMAVDEMVKAIIDALGNKIDNTIIIYTSDNGWSQGDHRKIGKNLQYESASKVPLIIRWPGIAGGQVRRQLVNNLDLTATVLDVAGATATNPLDGVSLENLIRDDTIPWRTSILIEAGHYSPEKYHSYSVRSNDWLYAESYSGGTSVVFHEVYNQTLDPYQLNNEVAPSKARSRFYSRVKDYFRDDLDTLKTCVGPSCWIEAFPALPKEKADE